MLDRTEITIRTSAHAAQVARANRDGWLYPQAPARHQTAAVSARQRMFSMALLPLKSLLAR